MLVSLKSIVLDNLKQDDINSIVEICNQIVEYSESIYYDYNLKLVFDYIDNYYISDNLMRNYISYLKETLLKINSDLEIDKKYRDYRISFLLNR